MPNQHSPNVVAKRSHYVRDSVMPLNPLIPGEWLLRLYETNSHNISKWEPHEGEGCTIEDICHGSVCASIDQRHRGALAIPKSWTCPRSLGCSPYEYNAMYSRWWARDVP